MTVELPEKKTPGQVCYEAFCPQTKIAWTTIPKNIQQEWEVSAQAVLKNCSPDDETPRTVQGWQKSCHERAKKKGWWDDRENRHLGDDITLMTTELSEAYEEWRNGHSITEIYTGKDGKPEGVPVELADLMIRVLDFCGAYGIDMQAVLELKHAYNAKRAYRHGGKRT